MLRLNYKKTVSILDTGPVVGSHLQKAAYGHTKPDASTITQQNVQNHLVPPALGKVRQQMHEEELWEQEMRGESASTT